MLYLRVNMLLYSHLIKSKTYNGIDTTGKIALNNTGCNKGIFD